MAIQGKNNLRKSCIHENILSIINKIFSVTEFLNYCTYCYVTLSHLRSKPKVVLHNLSTTLVVNQNIHIIPAGIHHQQQQNYVTTTLEYNYCCCNCIVFLNLPCILDFMCYLCNHVMLVKLIAYKILSLTNQMEVYSLPGFQKLVWHRLMKSCFGQHHTFQHCLDTFKLKKHAKCLHLAKTINEFELKPPD